jgi:hypothetical protein
MRDTVGFDTTDASDEDALRVTVCEDSLDGPGTSPDTSEVSGPAIADVVLGATALKNGGSFTGATVMLTVATSEDSPPSVARYVKLSDPKKSGAGV